MSKEKLKNLDFLSREKELKNYINKLDLYIVSHGGVGSNYIDYYLYKKGIKTIIDPFYRDLTYHYPYKIDNNVKTLYIYGDFENAIISQYEKNILHVNATKIQLIRDYDHESLDFLLRYNRKDPIGIKRQYFNFINSKNTYALKYPFTQESLRNVLIKLGINIDISDFEIRNRKPHDIENILKNNDTLRDIINIYRNFDDEINIVKQHI